MEILLFIVFFLIIMNIVAFLLGLIKPSIVIRWNMEKSRKNVLMVYGVSFWVLLLFGGFLSSKLDPNKDDKKLVKEEKEEKSQDENTSSNPIEEESSKDKNQNEVGSLEPGRGLFDISKHKIVSFDKIVNKTFKAFSIDSIKKRNGMNMVYYDYDFVTDQIFLAGAKALCYPVYLDKMKWKGIQKVAILNKKGNQGFIYFANSDNCSVWGNYKNNENIQNEILELRKNY